MRFLGIDAGGSKTIFAVCDEQGKVCGVKHLPALSLVACGGAEGLGRALRQGAASVMDGQKPDGVCLGIPCYGESVADDRTIRLVSDACFEGTRQHVCNDAKVAWAGSLALQPGVNIVAGTGAIGYGVDSQGKEARCGGWGYHFSDEGSGYWLGLQLLGLFCKQSDGRIPVRGPLYSLVRRHFSLKSDYDINDVAQKEVLPDRSKVAALQRVLLLAAQQGDESAIACYRQAGREIGQIAAGIISQLHFTDTARVSYSGGIFKVGAWFMESFRETLQDTPCTLVPPQAQPWAGALMLALAGTGLDTPAVIQNLKQDCLNAAEDE